MTDNILTQLHNCEEEHKGVTTVDCYGHLKRVQDTNIV